MKKGEEKPGTLIMAATHIGRPQDIPSRTLDAVREANLLIFEEDRPARALLKAAGVHREYLRFNEHGGAGGRGALALEELRRVLSSGGTAVYASDQGSPGVADPGHELVTVARELGAVLRVIPGPSSVTAAIAACPFPVETFHYAGFLPRQDAERRDTLRKLLSQPTPVVVMDTPYRLQALLADAAATSPDRRALLALDVSGEGEDYRYGTLAELAAVDWGGKNKRNFVMVVQT